MPKLPETLADIERIATMEQPVLRNLWITQRYHDLSRGLSTVLDEHNLNWSSFACWASLTAGISIRNRELPEFLLSTFRAEHRMKSMMLSVLGRFGKLSRGVFDVANSVLGEVSEQVASGNLKVFAELAPIFAKYIDLVDQGVPNERLVEALELRAGPVDSEGQDLLKSAFAHYTAARATDDAASKAQLILLGNCRIGLHEQTRLQPNIKQALEAPIDELLAARLKPVTEIPLFGKQVAGALNQLCNGVKRHWDEVVTRYFMNLTLPRGNEISLHRDVPTRARAFPRDLERLNNSELIDLLRTYDLRLDTLIGSGANDWAVLHDRMGFIVDLFRSRQQDLDLFGEPFSEAQRATLGRGQVPLDL